MVKISEIRMALFDKNFAELRALHDRAKNEGIEACEERQRSTVTLQMLTTSLFKLTSPGHLRTLDAMLDAVERGNHPYDDAQASAVMDADAAIAQAQLDAWVSQDEKRRL